MRDLSDNEIRALLYFAVGVAASGGGLSNQLRFDGRVSSDEQGQVTLVPASGRGYSIGMFGSALSRSNGAVASQLVDAGFQWTRAQYPSSSSGAWMLDMQLGARQRAQAVADLSRNGDQIKADGGRDLDPTIKFYLTRFLASHAGQTFMHKHDIERLERLMEDVVAPLRASELYQQATAGERGRLIAATANACGQSDELAQAIREDIRNGTRQLESSVLQRIFETELGLIPSHLGALAGAEIFRALQDVAVDNPLYAPWRKIVADAPINYRLAVGDADSSHLAQEYKVLRDLFAAPRRSRAVLRELNRQGSLVSGSPSVADGLGYHVDGHDFLTWDRSGRGCAFVNGQWRDFEREDLSLAQNANGTVDLHLHHQKRDEVLLHVRTPDVERLTPGHHVQHAGTLRENDQGMQVRQLQTELALLRYRGAGGEWLANDGNFGPDTRAALQAFQQDHHLEIDGIAGQDTFVAIHRALRARATRPLSDALHPGHYMFNRALGALSESDDWRESPARTERLAAAAAVAATEKGFTTIDRVAFNAAGTVAHFEQGERHFPVRQQVEVDVPRALDRPAAESGTAWYRAEWRAQAASLALPDAQPLQPQQQLRLP